MSGWLKYAPIPAAVVALLVLMGYARPVLISDAPPYAGIARVEKSEKHLVQKTMDTAARLEALLIRGNLLGAWRACRTALQLGDMGSVYDNAAQISMLQSEYVRLTGLQYPLPPCP